MNKKENFKEEPAWKVKMRKDFEKFSYENFMERHRTLDFEQWKFVGKLIQAQGPHFKKVGNRYLPIESVAG